MEEKWVSFSKYNIKYRVSSNGKVMYYDGTVFKEMPVQTNNYGQKMVIFSRLGASAKCTAEPVALLVAKNFVNNPHKYRHVSFIDGNPLNCKAENLVWVRQTDKQKAQYLSSRRKVNQYSIDGTFLKTYASLTDAAADIKKEGKHLKASSPSISHACQTGRPLYGYQWRYKNEEETKEKNIPPFIKKEQPVYCIYDKKTKAFIKEFKNLKEAALFLNKTDSPIQANIKNCCEGRRPSAYGYIWRSYTKERGEINDG